MPLDYLERRSEAQLAVPMWTYFVLSAATPCNQTAALVRDWLSTACGKGFSFELDSPCAYRATRPMEAYTVEAVGRLSKAAVTTSQVVIGVRSKCIDKFLALSENDLPEALLAAKDTPSSGMPDMAYIIIASLGALAVFIIVPTIFLLVQRKL